MLFQQGTNSSKVSIWCWSHCAQSLYLMLKSLCPKFVFDVEVIVPQVCIWCWSHCAPSLYLILSHCAPRVEVIVPLCAGSHCDVNEVIVPLCAGSRCDVNEVIVPLCAGSRCDVNEVIVPLCAGSCCDVNEVIVPLCAGSCWRGGHEQWAGWCSKIFVQWNHPFNLAPPSSWHAQDSWQLDASLW